MENNKKIKAIVQRGAVLLMTALLSETVLTPVLAGEPIPSVDETMYVNLDTYGKKRAVSVVKCVRSNGASSFTDYGEYTRIINMSNDALPQEKEGEVTWNLSQDSHEPFYYEGVMEPESVQLPWNFDVSYQLNGRPEKPENLAGASGLVEIRVQAEPNHAADLYDQNNMMLAVMFPADQESCYSIDAPGAQIQTIGSMTAAVFTALPGESGDFTARIGTDSYESSGILILMIPGTTDSLKHVKEIKEAKDTWREAGDAMYHSIDAMLASMESMKNGVVSVQESLTNFEEAREVISGSRSAIEAQNDASIQALAAMAQQSSAMVPYLQTAKDSAESLHSHLTEMTGTLEKMQTPLEELDEDLDRIQNGLERTADVLPGFESSLMEVIQLDTQLQAQEAAVMMTLVGFSETSAEDDIDRDAEEYADDQAMAYADAVMEAMGLDRNDPDQKEEYEKQHDAVYQQAFAQFKSGYQESAMEQLSLAMAQVENPKDKLIGKADGLETLASHSNALRRSAETLLTGADHSVDKFRDLTAMSDELLSQVRAMKASLDLYYPELQSALTDSQELLNRTNNLLNQTVGSMTIIQNTLKASSPSLDQGTKELIEGASQLLTRSMDVLDATGEIRKSSGVMKTTLDRELDKFEEENRFLDMDPEAEKVSFTSRKNGEPNSLQIILRTDEISLEEDENEILDAETKEKKENPFMRMWNVLVSLWNAAVEIFKNR
ncbi:MAG TPA: hypothetical protein IAA51_00735 [Candidatus Cottocaccamicrobium excrementipullorum]|nr:hypothetical protein [Candidatus Cottocaccamicrobium excrementipullorum]